MAEVAQLGAWQIAFWWFAFAIATATAWVIFGGQHRRQIADLQLGWLVWHWFTGGLLETSRTFPGLDDEEAPLVARVARRGTIAVARLAGSVAAGAVWYVNAGAPRGTELGTITIYGAVAAGTVAFGTLGIVHVACEAAHYLCWVRPLHLAVCGLLGWELAIRPGKYITVPRARDDAPEGIIVGFPPGFDLKPAHCEAVSHVVRRKLDLGEVIETWVPAGRHSYAQYRRKDPMPESAYYKDPHIRALVAQAKPAAPVVGVKRGGKPVVINLDSESPHVLISAGTGGGKSSLLRTITAQMMANGAHVMVIDIKRHSHLWLRGFSRENVHYARDIHEIHNVLLAVAAEGEKRNKAWDNIDIDEAGPVFPRLLLLCEEMTATTGKLRRWWKANRQPGDPNTSPAVEALEDIACMGRQVRIHIVAIAQMATAKSIGGSEIRENFPWRALGRYTKRAWEILVPECDFTPASREAGRMQICIGGEATETQIIYMTDKEARELASNGIPMPQRDSLMSPGQTPVSATATSPIELVQSPAGQSLVSLRQALETGLVDLSLAAIRSARARDPEFPPPDGRAGQTDLWYEDNIARWARNRPRATYTTNI